MLVCYEILGYDNCSKPILAVMHKSVPTAGLTMVANVAIATGPALLGVPLS